MNLKEINLKISLVFNAFEKGVVEMDYSKNTWKMEDIKYSPKRKVNNRASRRMPHIMGAFYADKMERVVEYESLNESIFCFLLEIDRFTKRYYVQPVEVPIIHINEKREKEHWIHVPDVLVFRQGLKPQLFQIKDTSYIEDEKSRLVNHFCEKYCMLQNWEYHIIQPKQLSAVIIKNLRFLVGFTSKRSYYDYWIPELIYRLSLFEKVEIFDFAKSFSDKINTLQVLPMIYHLIAIGEFEVDIKMEIGWSSEICIGNDPYNFKHFFISEGQK